MKEYEREISKDVYDRAMEHNGIVTDSDRKLLFTFDQLYGYGIYGAIAVEIDGKYIMKYRMGDSCD